MADPTLVDALAAGVLGVALFCAGRLVVGYLRHRPVERDVDITHLAMGVSMAAMLTGRLLDSFAVVWLAAFSASSCWFAWRISEEARTEMANGSGMQHAPGGHLQHLVTSVAMLYMVVAMLWLGYSAGGHGSTAEMAQMKGSAGIGPAAATPELAFAVAALLVLDAVIAATRVLRPVTVSVAGATGVVTGSVTCAAPVEQPRLVLGSRGTAACTLVMSLAMAYMFVTMRP